MIDKRLIGMMGDSKRYIAKNVALQWLALAANVAMIFAVSRYLGALYDQLTIGDTMAGAPNLPLTLGIVAAALLFALHIPLPAGLVTTISSVGNMIGPLGMLLAGMAIASSPLKKLVLTPRYYLTVFLRLILYPMVTLGLLWLLKAQTWIPDGKAILMTVFLSGITPVCSALNSMVQLYDRDMEESGALYVLTTLLSIVTMPLVIAVFERVM